VVVSVVTLLVGALAGYVTHGRDGVAFQQDARPTEPVPSPSPPPERAPVTEWEQREVAGPAAVVDSQDRLWQPARGLAGGRTSELTDEVRGTGSPQLYTVVRDGVASYTTAVPVPGRYAVLLLLAEPHTDAVRGDRVVDLVVDGEAVANGVDVYDEVGPLRALPVLVAVPVTGEELRVDFSARSGRPVVFGIEVALLSQEVEPRLQWSADFQGSAGAPPRGWNHEVGGHGWGNEELQHYTDRPENAQVDGAERLAIVARRERQRFEDGWSEYTSARLTTQHSFAFRYGLVKLRMTMPEEPGLWPAVWMIGADVVEVDWPRSGEIDIVEGTGRAGQSLAYVHGPDVDGRPYNVGRSHDAGGSVRPRDYELLWTPVGLRFAVGGDTVLTISPSDLDPGRLWVFDKPFFFVVNLAVGGRVPGPPEPTTQFPATLLVEHLRVYR
jgi:hypothetical protein